eukprot:g8074.t1
MSRSLVLVGIVASVLGSGAMATKNLRGDPRTLMHRPPQMVGIPSPEGSNFFHPDQLPTWMRPAGDARKMTSPNAAFQAMGVDGGAFQNPGKLPTGIPTATNPNLGGMYGSPVSSGALAGAMVAAPGLPGGAGVTFK